MSKKAQIPVNFFKITCPNIDHVITRFYDKLSTPKRASFAVKPGAAISPRVGITITWIRRLRGALINFCKQMSKIDRFVRKLLFLATAIFAWWRHDAGTLGGHSRFASGAENVLQPGARAKSIPLSVRPAWASENRSGQLLIAYSSWSNY